MNANTRCCNISLWHHTPVVTLLHKQGWVSPCLLNFTLNNIWFYHSTNDEDADIHDLHLLNVIWVKTLCVPLRLTSLNIFVTTGVHVHVHRCTCSHTRGSWPQSMCRKGENEDFTDTDTTAVKRQTGSNVVNNIQRYSWILQSTSARCEIKQKNSNTLWQPSLFISDICGKQQSVSISATCNQCHKSASFSYFKTDT